LKIFAPEPISDGFIEIGVEGADGGAVGFLDGENRKDRAEGGVNVDDIVASLAQDPPHVLPERQADRDAGLRAVGVDRLAPSNPDDTVFRDRAWKIGGYDVDVMAKFSGFTRKKMDMLADATQVRVVILGYQRDPQGARRRQVEARAGDGRRIHATGQGWPQVRHGQRRAWQ